MIPYIKCETNAEPQLLLTAPLAIELKKQSLTDFYDERIRLLKCRKNKKFIGYQNTLLPSQNKFVFNEIYFHYITSSMISKYICIK